MSYSPFAAPIASADRFVSRYRQRLLWFPFAAGALMFWASAAPWLRDPLVSPINAWNLPIDPGWQEPTVDLSYGLVCTGIALVLWLFVIVRILPILRHSVALPKLPELRHKGLFCFVPVVLFLGQMVCGNRALINSLTQHTWQMLLIQRLFYYPVADQLLPLHPFVHYSSDFFGRWQLLIDLVGYGPLLSLLAGLLLVYWEKLNRSLTQIPEWKYANVLPLSSVLFLCLVFARSSLGTLYEKQAQIALTAGAYGQALALLDTAHFLFPALDNAEYYHLERGQALYYLSPQRSTPESQAYLASRYRDQQDFPDALQLDSSLWQDNPAIPWIKGELRDTLEEWIYRSQPVRSGIKQDLSRASAVRPWLQELRHIDPTNLYGLYLDGRIDYLLHDYPGSISSMAQILSLSQDQAIRSSAYTYLALSDAGLGNPVAGRRLLFAAIELDPAYRNNTAREALSGLH